MSHLQCFRSHPSHHHPQHHQPHHQTLHLSPSPVHPQQSQAVAPLSITTTTATSDYYPQQHSNLYSSSTNDASGRLSRSADLNENGSNNRWRQQQPLSLADTHLSPSCDSQYSLLAASSASGAGVLDGSGSSSSACLWNDEQLNVEEEDLDFQHVSFDGAEITRFQALEIAREESKESLLVEPKKKREKKRRTSKSSYKHVPHREKPVHLVARRNARERKRVQAVNSAFVRLRKVVPVENRGKRLSKVKTLHRAIQYIDELTRILQEEENKGSGGVIDDDHCHHKTVLLSTSMSSGDSKRRHQKMLISPAVDSSCPSEQQQQQSQSSLAVIDQSDAVGHSFLEGPTIFNDYHHQHHHHHHRPHPKHEPTALMSSSSGALLTRRHQPQPQHHHQHHQLQQQQQQQSNALATFSFGLSTSLASSSSSPSSSLSF